MAARDSHLFGLPRAAVASLALAAVSISRLAAAEPASHRCAQVADDTARLRCYDEAFADPAVKPSAGFTAKVVAVEHRAQGQFVATLDNGEVWAQSEVTSKVRIAVGDVVRVRRASLGSYLLTGPQEVATRVKRVQ